MSSDLYMRALIYIGRSCVSGPLDRSETGASRPEATVRPSQNRHSDLLRYARVCLARVRFGGDLMTAGRWAAAVIPPTQRLVDIQSKCERRRACRLL